MAQYHKLFLNSNWILFEVQSQTEIRLISNQRAINRTIEMFLETTSSDITTEASQRFKTILHGIGMG